MSALKMIKLSDCSQKQREKLTKRSELDVASVTLRVYKITSDVREMGDEALLDYTEKLDGVKLSMEQLRVSKEEIKAAYDDVGADVVDTIKQAAKAIKKFHEQQMPSEWLKEIQPGIKAGQLVRPLARVGAYVPGGLARYPSSAIMSVVPAKVAGVKEIVVCTPPRRDGKVDPVTLVAADVAGADVVFKVGGAQAIAAMAYGTETIPKVDKVVGPGNIYVVAAKQIVSPDVGVDFAAGPSEVLIVADGSADAECVAADLLAQAEHDPSAAAVLVTTSEKLAEEVCKFVEEQLEDSQRKDIVLQSLEKYGRVIVARTLAEAIKFANEYAPEHLQLMVERPEQALKLVNNAGAIFLGQYSPVAAGDFAVGPNHILPTGGVARWRSGLSVLDFLRLPTVQSLTESGFKRIAGVVEKMAEVEGLPGHAQSIRKRSRRR
jgi:histidinol dehydrogenase